MNRLFQRDWFQGLHPSEDDLLPYLDGELSTEKILRIRKHLESCWSCRVKTEKIQEGISSFVDYLNCEFVPNLDPPPNNWRFFSPRLTREMAEGRASFFRMAFNSLGRVLSLPSLRFGIATITLVTAFSFLLLNYFNRVTPVSASELLNRAIVTQAKQIHEVPQPVIYQKLQVRSKTASVASVDHSVTWEIWNDTANSRFFQFVRDSNGEQFLPSPEETSVSSFDGRGSSLRSEVPPVLADLEKIFKANRMDWQQPLSPASYNAWRSSVGQAQETVQQIKLAGGLDGLSLRTTVQSPVGANSILEAGMLVRSRDWHPVEQHLRVFGDSGEREYWLTERSFAVLSLDALQPSLFGVPDPSSTLSLTLGREDQPLPSLGLSSNSAKVLAAEIGSHYALHRLKACLGEAIEVVRMPFSGVEVRGLVESLERKEALLEELRELNLVRVNIQTFDEAVRSMSQPQNSVSVNESLQVIPIITNQAGSYPIKSHLERYFAKRRAALSLKKGQDAEDPFDVEGGIVEVANRAISLSQSALAEAWALRRLADWQRNTKGCELPPQPKWLLEVMVRDHLAALKTITTHSRSLLEPILSEVIAQEGLTGAKGESISTGLSDGSGVAWVAKSLTLFATIGKNDQLIHGLFVGTSLPVDQTTEACRQLLALLSAQESEFVSVEAAIAREFSGHPGALSMRNHSE